MPPKVVGSVFACERCMYSGVIRVRGMVPSQRGILLEWFLWFERCASAEWIEEHAGYINRT